MKKTVISIILTLFLIIIGGGLTVVIWALHGPSLDEGQLVSVSSTPNIDGNTDPYFAFCDSIDCSCDCDDPFDPKIKSGEGAFAGKCLNSCVVRTVKEIPETLAFKHGYIDRIKDNSVKYSNSKYLVNVSHRPMDKDEMFYVALLDPEKVRDVLFVVEHAGGLKGHAELRFSFDKSSPVTLIPQRTESEQIVDHTSDLIFSVEAIAPPGVPYKGDYGFREEFFQRYRMCSIESKAYTVIKKLHRRVWQYRLNASKEEKIKMFKYAVSMANNADPNERYHTAKRNCALRAFDVINGGSKISWYRKPLLLLTNNTLFLPTRAEKHLAYRGLLNSKVGKSSTKNLEVELGWEEYVDLSMYED